MNRKIWILGLTLLFVLSGCASREVPESTIGVKNFIENPDTLEGKIAVEGIVQEVIEASFVFIITDEEDYSPSGLDPTTTASFITIYIPDSTRPIGKTPSNYTYKAEFPESGDRVIVEGELKQRSENNFLEVDRVWRDSEVIIKR